MPLKQTPYGGICPLEKFKIDVAAGAGCYTKDPVEACLECNFADTSPKGFDLEKICQCPSSMTWDDYDILRKNYTKTKGEHNRKGFWKYVKENYPIKVKENVKG